MATLLASGLAFPEKPELGPPYAVRSSARGGVYYVSADVAAGGESLGVATWAASTLGDAPTIYSVNPLARRISDWRRGDGAGSVSMDDPAAQRSQDCAAR